LPLPLSTAPGDTPLRRWARRAVTVPGFLLAFAVAATLYPLLLPAAALVDALRRSRLSRSRALTVIMAYLAFEAIGLLSLFWLALSGGLRGERERLFRFEWWWAATLLRILCRVYSMRLEVEGLEAAVPGPVLLFANHVSSADVLLPSGLVSRRTGLKLRYGGKLELIWDPCVDLAGHWLPNVFLRRGSADTPGDVGRVQALLQDLGPDAGVFLMPEGTRFTAERRARLVAGPASGAAAEMALAARRFRHLLPPRVGGVLALFEANPGADVVFLAHTGFEGARTLADFWSGALVGRNLRVLLWRRPWSSVPADRAGRVEWLHREWERLDAWLGERRAAA
jgi:1-acyl-sn-glycerol-3-phosphate acyltransferase